MEFADIKLIISNKEVIERLDKMEAELKTKNAAWRSWNKEDILQYAFNAFQSNYINIILTYMEYLIDDIQ